MPTPKQPTPKKITACRAARMRRKAGAMSRSQAVSYLIDKRRIAADDALTRDREETGVLAPIAPRMLYPMKLYAHLPVEMQRLVAAIAHGRSTTRAVLLGKSAARVLGMWTINQQYEPIELGLPSGSVPARAQWPAGVVYRRVYLAQQDVLRQDALRTTSPIRTAIDIARLHGFAEGLVAMDYLLARGATRASIQREILRVGPLAGIGVAREALRHAVGTSGSAAQSYARALLIEAGHHVKANVPALANLHVQLWLRGLILHIDEPTNTTNHLSRLTAAGFTVLRFTPSQLIQQPEQFLERVHAALAQLHEQASAATA